MSDYLSRRKFISSSLVLSTLAADATGLTSLCEAKEPAEEVQHKKKNKPKGMRLGSDTDKLYAVKGNGAFAILDYLKDNNFDGA